MSTIRELAEELGAQEHEIRAFWPDAMNMLDDDVTEIPADVEAHFRKAWGDAPTVPFYAA